MSYVSNLAESQLITGDVLLEEFILILLQLKDNDIDIDPTNLYHLLCSDGEFARMYEECDSHELNLFMQDKLISLVSKSLRKQMKKQGLTLEGDKIVLGNSVLSDSADEQQDNSLAHKNPLLSMHQINI